MRHARSQGALESLQVDRHGLLLEGTRTNIFACEEQKIFTAPKTLVLEGVTRHKIIGGIKELGYELVYEAPHLDEVLAGRFSELFISSTSMGALPIAQVEGYKFKAPFTVTNNLHSLVRAWERDTLP